MNDFAAELGATDVIDAGHPRLRGLASSCRSAATGRGDLARRLFEAIRDGVRYTPYAAFHQRAAYRASATLERGRGYCVQKAIALVAAARAAGIPARLVFADIVNHRAPESLIAAMGSRVFTHHAYAELWLDDRWVQATPAFDRELCAAQGWPLVEFDGRADAILPARDAAGRPFVDYTAHHGRFTDLPLERLLAAWDRVYGPDRVAQWRQAIDAGALERPPSAG